MIEAKVIEKSNADGGKEITTFQLRYPRFIHAEFMTHRVFSRNASSSRAIPVAKVIDQVRKEPAMPLHWGKNQSGMQAHEQLEGQALHNVQVNWRAAALNAAMVAEQMMQDGAHKQVVNRILEPFQFISVIVTATEWDNFYALRDHPDAQPEIQALAGVMREATKYVQAMRLHTHLAGNDEARWHLPYITEQERAEHRFNARLLCQLSAARCARVSYLTHDGHVPDQAKDLALFERLVGSEPLHASPIEHQAMAEAPWVSSRNFRGFLQFRDLYEAEMWERKAAAAGGNVNEFLQTAN